MKSYSILFILSILLAYNAFGQNNSWTYSADSVTSMSSPKPVDLNNDGIDDFVIGAGADGLARNNGILAIDGINGSLLWRVPARNEVFATAVFEDLNQDNYKDVIIGGRDAQLFAINGLTGEIIWEYFTTHGNPDPSSDKILNFYSVSIASDHNSDGVNDMIAAYGGDHGAPEWITDRPAGRLLIISGKTGAPLANAVVPDGKETYMSPVAINLDTDPDLEILFGTGGETIGGSLYLSSVSQLMTNSLTDAIQLATGTNKGFIAPPSIADLDNDGQKDIIIQQYDGTVIALNGNKFEEIWKKEFKGTESAAQPTIGNFTGNTSPDVFILLAKGTPSAYTDFYQILLDGSDGDIVSKDSVMTLTFASAISGDLNSDGREEIILSGTTQKDNHYYHNIISFDFKNNIKLTLVDEPGVNLGSTPLLHTPSNANSSLIYAYRQDSVNAGAPNGMYVKRMDLETRVNSGWNSYRNENNQGLYQLNTCGKKILIQSITSTNTCNSTSEGKLQITLTNPDATHTYLWSNGSTSKNLSELAAGTYKVIVTDSLGCNQEKTATVAKRFSLSSYVTPNNCPTDIEGEITYNSSGCGCQFSTCVFSWSNGMNGKELSGLSSGWYYLTLTHMDGCIAYDSVFVGPEAFILETGIVSQSDDDAFVKVTGGTPPYSYLWNDPFSQINDTAIDLHDGAYQVRVTDSKGCKDSITVDIILAFTDKNQPSTSLVHPNPADSYISINSKKTNSTYSWKIFAADGRIVKQSYSKVKGNTQIDIGGLIEGIYILETVESDQLNRTRFIVK